MSTTDVAERVAAGTAFLDEYLPGWEQRIDLGHLKLSDPCRCILGQLCEEESPVNPYARACRTLGIPWPLAIRRGFNEGDSPNWAALTAEWKRVIEQRRAAA